jgi:DNA repair photolyase
MAKLGTWKNDNSASLFPILPQAPVGMARLAAEAEHADDGHLIEFKAMQAKSILNKSVSKRRLWMSYSINPYRGCEFGCKYCYARYTHEFLQPEPVTQVPVGIMDAPQQPWALAFEHEIYLKENAAWLLEQELKKINPAEEIAIGTATDPYQPIERRVGITRSILEVFAKNEGYRIGIITKSNLIERDVDLLAEISKKNKLAVHITITTVDSKLARILEPRAPRPDLRFAAVAKLRKAGVRTGILCSPLLPGITDNEVALSAVAARAKEADASFLAASPLFLKSCSRPTYLSFVREHFPHLVEEYARRFSKMDFADAAYKKKLSTIVARVCTKHQLGERFTDALLTKNIGEGPERFTERKGPSPVGALPQAQAMLFA